MRHWNASREHALMGSDNKIDKMFLKNKIITPALPQVRETWSRRERTRKPNYTETLLACFVYSTTALGERTFVPEKKLDGPWISYRLVVILTRRLYLQTWYSSNWRVYDHGVIAACYVIRSYWGKGTSVASLLHSKQTIKLSYERYSRFPTSRHVAESD